MKKVILHIGMHKTGTTAIQSAFSGFDDGNFHYADLGNSNHSIAFYTAFSNRHQDYHIWRAAGLSAVEIERKRLFFRESIERAIRECDKNLIISGEDIASLPISSLIELKRIFHEANLDVSVVVYLRDPLSFVKSNLQEGIKGGLFNNTVAQPLYRSRLEKFVTVFGRNRILARIFDRTKLHQQNIVADFANLIGVSTPLETKENNVSLSTEAVKVKLISDEFVDHFDGMRGVISAKTRMMQHLRTIFPGGFSIPDHLIIGAIDNVDIEWLYKNFDIDFRVESPISSPYSVARVVEFLTTPDQKTIDTLKKYMADSCNVKKPPRDAKLLIARYFLTFLDSDAGEKFAFDPAAYLSLNPDVAMSGINPFEHYMRFGADEGRRTT